MVRPCIKLIKGWIYQNKDEIKHNKSIRVIRNCHKDTDNIAVAVCKNREG